YVYTKIQRIPEPKFRKAFCLKAGFGYQALKAYCEHLVYVTDGKSNDIEVLGEQLSLAFDEFDPDLDCIVPTGSSMIGIMTGYILRARFPFSAISVAFFQREAKRFDEVISPEDYIFYNFYPDPILLYEE